MRGELVSEAVFITVQDASDRCGVSVETIRRRLHRGDFGGVRREGSDSNSPWLIPVASLRAAGLDPERALRSQASLDQLVSERDALRSEHVVALEQLAYLQALVKRIEDDLRRERESSDHLREMLSQVLAKSAA
jgi:hypothetical protein